MSRAQVQPRGFPTCRERDVGYIEGIPTCRERDVGYIEGFSMCMKRDVGYIECNRFVKNSTKLRQNN